MSLKRPKLSSLFGNFKVLVWFILLKTKMLPCAASSVDMESEVKPTQISTILAETAKYFVQKLQIQNALENEDGTNFAETRGGGWGHSHGHGHGAITLDPVSIISLLALGAFLINNILQLLRTNMNLATPGNGGGGRSLKFSEQPFPFPPISMNSVSPENDISFTDFFGSLGSLYYLQPKKRHMCMKRVVCNFINLKESREGTEASPLRTKLFDFMITTVAKIVAPEMEEGSNERCEKTKKFCSDALLNDARISAEFKVYSQVSSWITKLAFKGLTTG